MLYDKAGVNMQDEYHDEFHCQFVSQQSRDLGKCDMHDAYGTDLANWRK